MTGKKSKSTVFFYVAICCFLSTLLFLGEALFSEHLSYFFPFVSYGGTFKWKYLQIGNMKISLYWSAHIMGVVFMCVICVLRRSICKLSVVKAVATGIMLAIFGFVGAKILFVLENIHYILQNNISIGFGGVSFFGTVFFMPLIIYVMGKVTKIDPLEYLDYCTPAGIVMLACIRLGCFMRGCCHGITVWIDSKPLIFPTQLIECTLDLFLLDYILKQEQLHKFKNGRYIVFMGIYGIIRFIVEFLRDTPKNLLGFSNGQIFSVICILMYVIYLITKRGKNESF